LDDELSVCHCAGGIVIIQEFFAAFSNVSAAYLKL
jgi:hypothetical protein